MYFPYLRGKQFELIAVDELADVIVGSSKRIIPIIEPIKDSFAKFKAFRTKEVPFVLIYNPIHGEYQNDSLGIESELIEGILDGYNNYYLGYIISQNTNLAHVKSFLERYKNKNICIIHYFNLNSPRLQPLLAEYKATIKYNIFIDANLGSLYKDAFADSPRIRIVDGFKNKKNAEYPDNEFFTDVNLTYSKDGYVGFGDFSIVGDQFSTTGGPAHAVAIHYSYINEENSSIWIRHFKSDSNGSPVDPAGKFSEALVKLVSFLNEPEGEKTKTTSAEEFIVLAKDDHFPGLGSIKKISMKHHIETVLKVMNS